MSGGAGAPAFGEADRRAGVTAAVTDFRIGYTGPDFVWDGETRPGLPVLHWPDGTIVEPVLLYFAWSHRTGRAVASSMRAEAYALRAWIAFLWSCGEGWDRGCDGLLRRWREEQRARAAAVAGGRRNGGRKVDASGAGNGARPPSPRRIEAKIGMVFRFYQAVHEAMCPVPGPAIPPAFVGRASARPRCPITGKEVVVWIFGVAKVHTVWEGAGRAVRRRVRRKTPVSHDVARILAYLRSRATTDPTGRATKGAQARSRLEAERNWLIARCEIEAGLRAEEVARLSLRDLAEAVAEAGAGVRALRRSASEGALASLGPGDRDAVKAKLDALVARGHRLVRVEVTCKGATRGAPFPIGLVRDLLDVGVWTVRGAQVDAWRTADAGYDPPSAVFLSSKTRRGMLPGTIADMMGDAFDALDLRGSGHRLRAYCAVEMAMRLIQERLPLNGFIYDSEVENWVLLQVAEALGHGSISTTTRHYVDAALMRLLGLATKAKLVELLAAGRDLGAVLRELGNKGRPDAR